LQCHLDPGDDAAAGAIAGSRVDAGRACLTREGLLHCQVPRDGRHAWELLGGNGILLENHIGRFVADAEAIYSYEGTREMNTLIVGKAITGLSAFV
jgi:acyl-CoA dehydrogenase-like protein